MRNKKLWKGFSLALAVMTAVCAVPVGSAVSAMSATEFTDGNVVEEADATFDEENTFIDKAGVAKAEPFTDSETLQGEETVAVEDMDVPSAHAQNLYQVSVSGELILSETQKFVKLLNAERAKLGVPPVQLDQEMMEKAKERAIQGSIAYGHNQPDGTVMYLVPGHGECACAGYEQDIKSYFNALKNSPGHWSILIDKNRTRFGFACFARENKHNIFGLTSYYGYTVGAYDSSGDPFNAYTGDFNNKKINNYQISIINKYLDMINENINITVGSNILLKPTYKVYDTVTDNNRDYNFGYGTLSNTDGVWDSDNPSVATIDADGNLKALKGGTAVVRFYVNGDRDKYYQNVVTVEAVAVKPGRPSLKGGPYKYSQIKLTWNKTDNADGYQVYRYNSSSKKYERIATLKGANTLSYNQKVGYGKAYSYKVRAYNKEDGAPTAYSSSSSAVKVKTAPYTPSISGIKAGNRELSVTWKAAKTAESYQIYRASSKTGTYTKVKTVSSKTLSYKNTGLSKGKTYYYKVRAYRTNADGKRVYGKFSPVVGKKTK